jgi:hypothetical protein
MMHDGAADSSETSVHIYDTTGRHITNDPYLDTTETTTNLTHVKDKIFLVLN